MLTCYRESQRNAATARSLGLTQHLQKRLDRNIDSYVAAALAGAALSQWLALRLQLLSALLVAGLAGLAVVGTSALPFSQLATQSPAAFSHLHRWGRSTACIVDAASI